MPRFAPCSPDDLVRMIGERCLERTGRVRVAVDGAAAAEPRALAERAAAWLRQAGRPAEVIDLEDFQLPASIRLENGRDDPESFRSRWFDYAALAREVLDPLGPGSADPLWLPRLRDAVADRAARTPREPAPPSLVLLAAGPMLLGRWLDFDLTVQLTMDAAVLQRRTPPAQQFTVPALSRYQDELNQEPDILVRYNHPERPAVMER